MREQKLIFVSCGQKTAEEKQLGAAVARLINNTDGFHAYFADQVHDLDGLSDSIFEALRKCSGMVAILHSRGKVISSVSDGRTTSSIWINQEISALAYRRAAEGTSIPIRVFQSEEVELEGAMTSLIVNPIRFSQESEVLDKVRSWLSSENFRPRLEEAEFQRMVNELEDNDWKVIEAVFAGAGSNVTKAQIKRYLRERCGFSKNDASKVSAEAVPRFQNNNLILCGPEGKGVSELSVNPEWKFELRRTLNKRSSTGTKK